MLNSLNKRSPVVSLRGGSVSAEPLVSSIPTEESHLKVLRLLEADPALSQRDLSQALGISLGKTNYCMRALLSKGLIKMQNFRNSGNKLGYVYLLTPAGITAKAEMTRNFLKIKMREYEILTREIDQLRREVEESSSL